MCIRDRHKIIYAVTTKREFNATVEQFYGGQQGESDTGDINEMLFNLADENVEEGLNEIEESAEASDNELVKLVNKIIIDAYKMGVSDIHVEPYTGKEKTKIRFRKDGSLMSYIEVPASYRNPLVTRIKIMCDMDISEKRRPQDGKIKFRKFSPLDIELRVATIPSAGGLEDVLLRILSSGGPITLGQICLLFPPCAGDARFIVDLGGLPPLRKKAMSQCKCGRSPDQDSYPASAW